MNREHALPVMEVDVLVTVRITVVTVVGVDHGMVNTSVTLVVEQEVTGNIS